MPYRKVHRIADRAVPRYRDTFLASVARIRRQVTIPLVADDMANGILEPPARLFNLVDAIKFAKEVLQDPERVEGVYAEILSAAGRSVIEGAFDIHSPLVQWAARTMAGNLIRDVSAETKAAVRQIIYEAVRDGVAPREAAKLIRATIGLTRGQAGAVSRLAATLSDNPNRDRLVAKYGEKLLRTRALTIARTETIRASNKGQQLAWQEMVRDSLIDTSRFRQRWLVTPDDRLCPVCAPMDGKLVQLGGKFESNERGVLPSERESYSGATVESPPLHPRCRCALVGDFGDE